ncbi:EpsG family protein [Roseateles sp. NT4]|uniref:EpsG family protein n=1 Tax=Roseateles sp. NT4 TaxID=3453715 RepID=UPI003EE99625
MIAFIFAIALTALFIPVTSRWQARVTLAVLALGFAVAAGLRSGGFDYDEYVYLIETLRTNQDLDYAVRLYVAKDPLFLGFIDVTNLLDFNDSTSVFLLFAITSLAARYFSALPLGRLGVVYLGTYILLLAPALELAAIRAALAISLLICAIAYRRSAWIRVPLAAMATLSHISVLPAAALLVFSKIWNTRVRILAFGSIAAALTLVATNFLADLVRAEGLTNNRGNLSALLFPLLTLGLLTVQLRVTRASDLRIHALASVFVALSLGMVLPAVTISIRLLEIGWCVMHYGMFVDLLAPENRAVQRPLKTTLGAFLFMLLIANLLRATLLTAVTL